MMVGEIRVKIGVPKAIVVDELSVDVADVTMTDVADREVVA